MLRTRLLASRTTGLVLALGFAALLLPVQVVETLLEPLRVDPARPAPVTLRLPPLTVKARTPRGALRTRTLDTVVARGERLRDPAQAALVRLYETARRPPPWLYLVGLFAFDALLAALLLGYLHAYSRSRGTLLHTQLGLFTLLALFVMASKVVLLLWPVPAGWLPVALLPLWVAHHLDRRTAVIVGVVTTLLTAPLVVFRLDFVYSALITTSVAAISTRPQHRRGGLWMPTLIASVAALLSRLGVDTLAGGGLLPAAVAHPLWLHPWVAATGGALLAGALAYLATAVATRLLGVVSRARLMELSDLSQPLLKKMAREAPGSWEHSRAMANLAEAATAAIGADSLLTRIGAYYHDLGKSCQPEYFVENLPPGTRSPHLDLEPDVSADAIMAHVVEGTKILRQGGIPEAVVEFAYTHHGTSVIEYFWHQCVAQGNPKGLEESAFRYPGMRPRTKETAVLMLVDAIEAAARTIEEPTHRKFTAMIDRILLVKMRQGQLDDSGMSAREIRIVCARLADTLCSVYHSRIKYPWQKRRERGDDSAKLPLPTLDPELAGAPTQPAVRTDPATPTSASPASASDAPPEKAP
ncbi:MAG: HDIG domain-containing metalloprotein [Polyangiales bacterium]